MADKTPFMNKKDGCIPFEFFADFLDFVKRNDDLIEVITYDDLPWGEDWDYMNHYPDEWARWKARIQEKTLDPDKVYLLIQHDVDSHPDRNMAAFRAEQERGIRSNIMLFHERVDRQLLANEGVVRIKHYDLDMPLLKSLEQEGFVIGYHCNAVEKADFDLEKAEEVFRNDLNALRENFDIRYFSPHGGVRGPEGWSNTAIDIPADFRDNLRWVHNRQTARMHGNYSDGGINGKRIAADERDPRDFVRKWLPGRRYRMLFHPQYYHTPYSETKGLAKAEWYREMLSAYREGGSQCWPDSLLDGARQALLDSKQGKAAQVAPAVPPAGPSESPASGEVVRQVPTPRIINRSKRILKAIVNRLRRLFGLVRNSSPDVPVREVSYRLETPELHSNPGPETAAGGPILIGGDGRSGTTLLSVILDSHPDLSVGPELHFNGKKIPNLGPAVLEALDELDKLDGASQGPLLADRPDMKPAIQYVNRVVRAGFDLATLREVTMQVMEVRGNELAEFQDRCAVVRELGERNAKKDGKSRWGFKIMREIKNLEKYAETFPDATYIHIIRDGRDVAASQISEHGSWGYGDISRAAAGWCSVIDGARATSGSVRYTEVRYEDIVMKPEETIRRLLDFLGVDWDPAVLAHSEQGHSLYETKVRHPSRDQVARPINDSALGRYRRDLKPEQIEAFEKVAGASLVSLGYMNTDAKNERK